MELLFDVSRQSHCEDSLDVPRTGAETQAVQDVKDFLTVGERRRFCRGGCGGSDQEAGRGKKRRDPAHTLSPNGPGHGFTPSRGR